MLQVISHIFPLPSNVSGTIAPGSISSAESASRRLLQWPSLCVILSTLDGYLDSRKWSEVKCEGKWSGRDFNSLRFPPSLPSSTYSLDRKPPLHCSAWKYQQSRKDWPFVVVVLSISLISREITLVSLRSIRQSIRPNWATPFLSHGPSVTVCTFRRR